MIVSTAHTSTAIVRVAISNFHLSLELSCSVGGTMSGSINYCSRHHEAAYEIQVRTQVYIMLDESGSINIHNCTLEGFALLLCMLNARKWVWFSSFSFNKLRLIVGLRILNNNNNAICSCHCHSKTKLINLKIFRSRRQTKIMRWEIEKIYNYFFETGQTTVSSL